VADFHLDAQPQFVAGAAGLEPVRSFRQLLWNELKAGHVKVDTSNMTHAVIGMKALHPQRLQAALGFLVARHPVLGGRIEDRSGEPWIHSDPTNVASLEIIEAGTLEEAELLLSERIWHAFALNVGPLHRAIAVRLETGACFIALVVHHFVIDGFSISVLASDFAQIYVDLARERTTGSSTQILCYPDYIDAINQWSRTERAQRYIDIILGRYLTIDDVDLARRHTPHVGEDRFEIRGTVAQRIRDLARSLETTPFTVFLAAQFALLRPFSANTAVGIKTVTTGRELPILMPVIGNLANRMLVTLDLAGADDFQAVVQRTTAALKASRQTSFVRDDFVQSRLAEASIVRPAPMFNFMSSPSVAASQRAVSAPQLKVIQPERSDTTRPRDHYFLFVVDDGESFNCKAQYAAGCAIPLPAVLTDFLIRVTDSSPSDILDLVQRAWSI
jgi:hypothetical protein